MPHNRRQHLWLVVAHPIWKWLIVGALGSLSLVAFVRDEFLQPQTSAKFHLLDFLPAFSWKDWALVTLIALVAIIFEASFRAYRVLSSENETLAAKLAPKLSISFGRDVPGCIVRTNFTNGVRANFVRVRIEACAVGYVPEAIGHVVSLRRNGTLVFDNESIALPMAPAERQNNTFKNIYDKVPAFLDLLVLVEPNLAFPPPGVTFPNSIGDLGRLYVEHGEYVMTLAVSSPITVSVTRHLKFKWTGDWETAEIGIAD